MNYEADVSSVSPLSERILFNTKFITKFNTKLFTGLLFDTKVFHFPTEAIPQFL